MARRWEYKAVWLYGYTIEPKEIRYFDGSTGETVKLKQPRGARGAIWKQQTITEMMNTLGNKGWELAARDTVWLYFKRPVAD
jgi:hypothetical protein